MTPSVAVQSAQLAGLSSSGNHLCTWPTGTGKTYTSREAAKSEIARGHKVIVIVPLRALAAEVRDEWRLALDAKIESYTGDSVRPRRYAEQDILILTPERLDLVGRSWRKHHDWLSQVGLVIVDELHLLGDGARGARLDGALTRLHALCPLIRTIGLSATIGEPGTLASWLGASHWDGAVRPVPLRWHVHDVKAPRQKEEWITRLIEPGCVVFVNSRKRAEELSAALQDSGSLRVAAHHAGFSQARRTETEGQFRRGELDALIATGTLEMGLNLPCRSVILADLSVWSGGKMTPLSMVTLWQRAGRAGRDPALPHADVHLLALPSERDTAGRVKDGHFEPLRSALGQEGALLDFVLGSIDAGMTRTPGQLERLLNQTFAARTGLLRGEEALARLIRDGGVEHDPAGLRVTPLGRVASQALLPLAAVRAAEEIDPDDLPFDLLVRLCQACELPGVETRMPYQEGGDWAAENALDAALESVPSRLLDGARGFPRRALHAAALLRSACLSGDEEAAAAEGLGEASVTGLRESAARIAQAWCQWRPELRRLKLVAVMLAAGVPYSQASLTLLSGVGGVLARRLAQAGAPDIEALAGLRAQDLKVPGVSHERLCGWIWQAERLVKTFDSDVTAEGQPGQRGGWAVPMDWRGSICTVRLRRAAHLRVTPDGGGFEVTGGAQAHHATADACDCPDHLRTQLCKHVLAVRLHSGDPETLRHAALLMGEVELTLLGWRG